MVVHCFNSSKALYENNSASRPERPCHTTRGMSAGEKQIINTSNETYQTAVAYKCRLKSKT